MTVLWIVLGIVVLRLKAQGIEAVICLKEHAEWYLSLRPSGAGPLNRPSSPGFASAGFAALPLHPWLQPVAPLGRGVARGRTQRTRFTHVSSSPSQVTSVSSGREQTIWSSSTPSKNARTRKEMASMETKMNRPSPRFS